MIDQISPINNDNKFLDLGSGVGQVTAKDIKKSHVSACMIFNLVFSSPLKMLFSYFDITFGSVLMK